VHEGRELSRFFENVNLIATGSRQQLAFPQFKWRQVNAWRIGFQLFPLAGLEMLRRFCAQSPKEWSRDPARLAGTLLLISPLTVVGDRLVGGKAHDLLREFRRHFDKSPPRSESDYFVRANFFAVDAESYSSALTAYRNFTERHEVESLELKIMRYYYGRNNSHSAMVVKAKLERPTPRLVNTLPHEVWRADMLRKHGVSI